MKIIRAVLLVMALGCSVYAGDIPNNVTVAGYMPNGVAAAGDIPNNITAASEMPNGATLLNLLLILL